MIGPSPPLALTVHLALVSSISFGGFPTVLPDLRDFIVGTNRWMTNQEFANHPSALSRPLTNSQSVAAKIAIERTKVAAC